MNINIIELTVTEIDGAELIAPKSYGFLLSEIISPVTDNGYGRKFLYQVSPTSIRTIVVSNTFSDFESLVAEAALLTVVGSGVNPSLVIPTPSYSAVFFTQRLMQDVTDNTTAIASAGCNFYYDQSQQQVMYAVTESLATVISKFGNVGSAGSTTLEQARVAGNVITGDVIGPQTSPAPIARLNLNTNFLFGQPSLVMRYGDMYVSLSDSFAWIGDPSLTTGLLVNFLSDEVLVNSTGGGMRINPLGQTDLGGAKIINVAAGVNGTDGVNFDQMLASAGVNKTIPANISTTSTTLVDATGMVISGLAPSTKHRFVAQVAIDCSGTGGVSLAVNVTGSPIIQLCVLGQTTVSNQHDEQYIAANNTAQATPLAQVASTRRTVFISGHIITDSSPSQTVQLRYASAVGGQTSRIFANGTTMNILRDTN